MVENAHHFWKAGWRLGIVLALLLFVAPSLPGQETPGTPVSVRWPLVDLVLVPDSCYGIWLLAAPNVTTSNWDKGSQIVQFTVPLTLLQWAGTAQALVHRPARDLEPDSVLFRATPRLQSRRGGRFILLAKQARPARAEQRLELIVSDSANHTQWKAFATTAEVDRLLAAIEEVVARAPSLRPLTDSSLVADDQVSEFAPVVQLKVPKLRFPSELLAARQPGRVWAEYVVGIDGHVEKGSIRILLADHEGFATAAVSSLERPTFRPASRRGSPVRQRVFQTLSFRVGR